MNVSCKFLGLFSSLMGVFCEVGENFGFGCQTH